MDEPFIDPRLLQVVQEFQRRGGTLQGLLAVVTWAWVCVCVRMRSEPPG